MSGMDVYNFLHMINSADRINSNPACLREEVGDQMKMDRIKFNLSWQEIEVDNLMGLDEIKSNSAWQEVEVDKSDENG